MRVGLILLGLAFGVAAAHEPATSQTVPPLPVEHVVTLAGTDRTGRNLGRETIRRSAGRERRDRLTADGLLTIYDLHPSDVTVSIRRRPDGSVAELNIWRQPADPSRPVVAAGDGVVLGERCTIWRPVVPTWDTDAGVCATPDGIVLWTRKNSETWQATEVTRRAIPASEMRPPDETLSLGYWQAEAAKRAVEAPARDAENYQIVLEVPGEPWDDRLTRRERRVLGSRAYEAVRSVYGWEDVDIRHGQTFQARYRVDARDGRLLAVRLALRVKSEPDSYHGRSLHGTKPTRAARAAGERVLGEACEWFSLLPDVFDLSWFECRASDGIPLIFNENSWGIQTTLKATKLLRNTMTEKDFEPPARILDLTAWGVMDAAAPREQKAP